MVIHPVNLNPPVLSSCFEAECLSLLTTDDKYLPWIYENFIGVTYTYQDKNEFVRKYSNNHDDGYLSFYSEVMTFTPFRDLDQIPRMVSEGSYVFVLTDLAMMREHKFYGNKDMHDDYVHEIVINGYDEGTKELLYTSFGVNGATYGNARTTFEDLEASHKSVVARISANKEKHRGLFRYYMPLTRVDLRTDFSRGPDLYRLYILIEAMLEEIPKKVYTPAYYNKEMSNPLMYGHWHIVMDLFRQAYHGEDRAIPIIEFTTIYESCAIFVDMLEYLYCHRLVAVPDDLLERARENLRVIEKCKNVYFKLMKYNETSVFERLLGYLEEAICDNRAILGEVYTAIRQSIASPVL